MPIEHPRYGYGNYGAELAGHSAALQSMREMAAMTGARDTAALRDYGFLSPLPEDAERIIDNIIITSAREKLNLVSALISAGMTTLLPNWMSVLFVQSNALNNTGEAQQTMEFDVRAEDSGQDMVPSTIPVYGTWEAFKLGNRFMAVAGRNGVPVEERRVTQSLYNVNRAIEFQAIRGLMNREKKSPMKIAGFSAPGIFTTLDNVYRYKDNEAWTATTHDGPDIVDDLAAMNRNLLDRGYDGRRGLIVSPTYDDKLNLDYFTTASGATTNIRQRILENQYGGGPLTIIPVPLLDVLLDSNGNAMTDYTVMFQMDKLVMDILIGQTPQQFSWRVGNGPFAPIATMLIACMIFRVHADYDGDTGFVVGHKDAL